MKATTNILRFIVLWLFCSIGPAGYAQNDLKILSDSLNTLLEREHEFIRQKEERIKKIKRRLKNVDRLEEYNINQLLYDEYQKFNIDSAVYYIKRNINIAMTLGEKDWGVSSNLKLSLVYSMGGMYREAELILKEIDPSGLSKELLAAYYEAYYRFWEYYAISTTRSNQYRYQREMYRNLFLANADFSSVNYKVTYIVNRVMTKDRKEGEKQLLKLLDTEEVGSTDYAIITCALAIMSRDNHQPDMEKKYFMQSAIADVKNVTRENISLQNLAVIAYNDNDLAQAFKYTQAAINEATASGIQFRATQINEFYSVINAAYQEQEAKAKSSLIVYLVLITTFFVFLVVLVIYTYHQIKKIRQIKEELFISNEKLQELNTALNKVNDQLYCKNHELLETNNIKEQFIAQFFDLCSNYITRMEEYQNSLYKLAINRSYEQLIKKLKSTTNIDEELNALYSHFDSIFLNLYPTFVTDFNALLKEGEQVIPKAGTLLSKELRIYALIRIGINDGVKIANFLRCSTSTVYNYRTKMRNKAMGDKENFENEILQIGSAADYRPDSL